MNDFINTLEIRLILFGKPQVFPVYGVELLITKVLVLASEMLA
jgi:hypothetical protein